MIDTDAIVAALHELQGSTCGICGRAGQLFIDHDHATGFVRGLLCMSCNNHEGQHGRCLRPDGCRVCLWRIKPATSFLGWTVTYKRGKGSPFARNHRGYAPSFKRAEAGREQWARAAEAVARMYSDLPLPTPTKFSAPGVPTPSAPGADPSSDWAPPHGYPRPEAVA